MTNGRLPSSPYAIPAAVMRIREGKHIPTIAATAPSVPRKRWPTRIDMFVAFKPGNVLLSDISSRNSVSFNHFFLVTSALRR